MPSRRPAAPRARLSGSVRPSGLSVHVLDEVYPRRIAGPAAALAVVETIPAKVEGKSCRQDDGFDSAVPDEVHQLSGMAQAFVPGVQIDPIKARQTYAAGVGYGIGGQAARL